MAWLHDYFDRCFFRQSTFTTVQVNQPDDPIDSSNAYPEGCGYERCGGLGDFLDMAVDQYGRPWFSLANNDAAPEPDEGIGIFATIIEGPSLRSETVEPLVPLPIGGRSTI